MKKSETYGIEIHSMKGKGYMLKGSLVLLDEKLIRQRLEDKNIDIQVFETLPSTHDFKNFPPHLKMPGVCLAEQQTQGKGRLGRYWHSPFGQNLYFSCLYTFQKDISGLAGLSLVVSLAVIKTLRKYPFPDSPLIKWPNDIIYHSQKLAGILIEIKADAHNSCQALISIGMNVNMLNDANNNKNISQLWTSLRQLLDNSIDRNHLCAELINHLMAYLKKFENQGLAVFINEWQNVDALWNKQITVNCAKREIQGTASGINAQGHLLLKLENGEIQAFSSGDTTVLKQQVDV